MIQIKNRTDDSIIIYTSQTAVTIKEAVIEAVRAGVSLENANLEGANLENSNLWYANLWGANLENANLEGANLENASLGYAYLVNAYLENANLENANLGSAYLEDASLKNANLWNANLKNANLVGANLEGANLWNANLWSANLENANLQFTILDPDAQIPVIPDKDIDNAGLEIISDETDEWVYGYRTAKSQHCGNTEYKIGKTYKTPWFSVCDTDCHPGIYLASKEWLINGYGNDIEIVRCRTLRCNLHRAGDKWRCRELEIVEE